MEISVSAETYTVACSVDYVCLWLCRYGYAYGYAAMATATAMARTRTRSRTV